MAVAAPPLRGHLRFGAIARLLNHGPPPGLGFTGLTGLVHRAG